MTTIKLNLCRVAWNTTGTVLATSVEDGTLSLWWRNLHQCAEHLIWATELFSSEYLIQVVMMLMTRSLG